MELKKAVAVCLISLFSATLVVLIARSLDLATASRLEPQLEQIVKELQAIRRGGALPAADDASTPGDTLSDGLMVYYFHGNTRCPTCRTIEAQSHETVQASFPLQLESGQVLWQTLNYEDPTVAEVPRQFEIQMPGIVLAKMKAGRIDAWRSLDDVWTLVDDEPAFADYVRSEIREMLAGANEQPVPLPASTAPEVSVHNVGPRDVPAPVAPKDSPDPR